MSLAFATNGKVQGTVNGTSLTATFPNSHTAAANSFLLAIQSCSSTSAVTTPTGYTLLASSPYVPGANNRQINIYGKKAAGTETTITITQPSSRGNVDFLEITGMATADIDSYIALTLSLQAAESDGSAATSQASVSVDPTQTGEVMMLSAWAWAGTPGSDPTWNQSYATVNAPITNSRQAVGYLIGTALGAQTPTATWTTSTAWENVHLVLQGPQSSNASPGPSVVAGVAAQPAATEQTGTSTVPASVAGVAAQPAPTETTGQTVSATVVAGTAGSEAMGAETDTTVTPSAVAGTAAQPAASVGLGTVVTPATAAGTAAQPAPTDTTGETATPATAAGVAAQPAVAIQATGVATVPASAVAGTAAQPAATEKTGETVSATTVAGAADQPSASAVVPSPSTCTDRDDFGRAFKRTRMRSRSRC